MSTDFDPITLSSICSLYSAAQTLTGCFRDELTRHFAAEDLIENPDLRHLVWRDGERTNILIESVWRWNPATTGKRPAVLIKRNAYTNHRVGIGDKRQGPASDKFGFTHFETFWIGSHSLFCIGGTGSQADLLATEVSRQIHEFGQQISKELGLYRFAVLEVGAVAKLEESTENFVVPVNVGYAFSERWSLRQQAPRLKRVSLNVLLNP